MSTDLPPMDEEYLKARRLLVEGEVEDRITLAKDHKTRPEVLYFLAEDESPDVRRDVAANANTPHQADLLLVGDDDDGVRAELARKIARLVPGLDAMESGRLHDHVLTMLDQLAKDSLPKVRAILAEEIKRSALVPKPVILKLARDLEETVSCPILEYSPLLDDDDLREIIAAGLSQQALVSIARRDQLSENVSDDIAGSLEIPAVAALLANPSAQIREETLDQIIEQARKVSALHKPLALKPALSIRAMKRIASFVASALVHQMIESSGLDHQAADGLLDEVRKRIMTERVDDSEAQRLAEQARDHHRRGMLTDDFIADSITANRRELLIQCLAVMSELEPRIVRQILFSKSGRAVTALVWKAGLSMRTAFQMQTEIALVSPAQRIAAQDGKDYPMDEDEMVWQLSYYTD
ncbi:MULTISPECIES: DUF2336 domain-containing protein [unclassified Iodidimonas]|jgi:uncharacterized protein (DUF2336 family)|uniref:DUF2336 domain-containing protein n=1 Tax=unclassified Iodidimonas TaxID=2626145 RepID=UPI00248214DB|nr:MULTISPECIES: DUF2336 domain-containing protein [unclassified Iodidimonas]